MSNGLLCFGSMPTTARRRRKQVTGGALLALTLTLSVCSATSGALSRKVAFRTPGDAIYCTRTRGEDQMFCWRTSDGVVVTLTQENQVFKKKGDMRGPAHDHMYPFLAYGKSTVLPYKFRCTSLRAGVRCLNQHKHGFVLGRKAGYKRL